MKHFYRLKLTALFLTAILFSGRAAFADEAQLISMIRDLQTQMQQMRIAIEGQNEKIRQLETRGPAPAVSQSVSGETPAAGASAMSEQEFNERLAAGLGGANKWLKDLSFKGDLRLRYEAFQNHNGTPAETDDRNRFRYRLRYGFEKKFNEDMKVGFSMASGEAVGGTSVDPTGANASFDNDFTFKHLFIEKAYAQYRLPFLRKGVITDSRITAGKHDNPFEKGSSDIIWDRDVKPEGVSEQFDMKLIETSDFNLNGFLTTAQYILDEDATVGGDAYLWAHQLGWSGAVHPGAFERPVDYLGAVSYYSYGEYATGGNFTVGGTSLARGNSNIDGSATDLDVADFEILELYHELSFYPAGFPVRPFFDWARNIGGDLRDGSDVVAIGVGEQDAWALGFKLGAIAKKGDWEFQCAYKRIDANAVPGFNDGDFGNSGHSGKRGSVFKAGYAFTDAITLNLTAFFVNNLNADTSTVLDEEQRRFQTDLVWKF